MGSVFSPFLTWSDSPVRELSSTLRSLLWIMTPSAGRRSPYLTWQISPTTRSWTRIWMTSPDLITENLCSCSIRLWRPAGQQEQEKSQWEQLDWFCRESKSIQSFFKTRDKRKRKGRRKGREGRRKRKKRTKNSVHETGKKNRTSRKSKNKTETGKKEHQNTFISQVLFFSCFLLRVTCLSTSTPGNFRRTLSTTCLPPHFLYHYHHASFLLKANPRDEKKSSTIQGRNNVRTQEEWENKNGWSNS